MNFAGALRFALTRIAERPSLFVAEFAWRWVARAAIVVLLAIGGIEYLDSIVIVGGEGFRGAGAHFLRLVAALLSGCVLLWCLAEAAGRNAILTGLLDDARSRETSNRASTSVVPSPNGTIEGFSPCGCASQEVISPVPRPHFGTFVLLSFLRAALALVATLSVVGAWFIAAIASGNIVQVIPLPNAAGFWLLFCPLVLMVFAVWMWFYWIVSLAPITAITENSGANAALQRAVELIYERPLQLGAMGAAFGFLRLAMFTAIATAMFAFVETRSYTNAALCGLAATVLVLYCLISDWIYLGRLATFMAMASAAE